MENKQKNSWVEIGIVLLMVGLIVVIGSRSSYFNSPTPPKTALEAEEIPGEISLGVVGNQSAGETPHVAFFSNTHPLRFIIQLQLIDKDGKERFIERLSATYDESAKKWVDFYLVTGSDERGLDGRSYNEPTTVDLERLNQARAKYLDLLANERK